MSGAPTLDEICVVACAEAWRGDGEILASPMGIVPTIGARLAAATFAQDLLVTDGEASLIAGLLPVGAGENEKVIEGWLPFRSVFDLVWAGRRHVMMGASQIDRFGNQNMSCIGDWRRPKVQLLGARGGPGNTVNHATSYWISNHSPRVFVEEVDFVSGVGYRRAAEAGPEVAGHHEIRRVVTNKAVFDFETSDRSMRLRSVHPGVSIEDVEKSTGFPLSIPYEVEETRVPTDEELELIREVLDPQELRKGEVAA
jgi:acyl CoA:acetate/3-ketoacid CoA transferase beta subunit